MQQLLIWRLLTVGSIKPMWWLFGQEVFYFILRSGGLNDLACDIFQKTKDGQSKVTESWTADLAEERTG